MTKEQEYAIRAKLQKAGMFRECPTCKEISIAYIKDPMYMYCNPYGTYMTCLNKNCKEYGIKRNPYIPFSEIKEEE